MRTAPFLLLFLSSLAFLACGRAEPSVELTPGQSLQWGGAISVTGHFAHPTAVTLQVDYTGQHLALENAAYAVTDMGLQPNQIQGLLPANAPVTGDGSYIVGMLQFGGFEVDGLLEQLATGDLTIVDSDPSYITTSPFSIAEPPDMAPPPDMTAPPGDLGCVPSHRRCGWWLYYQDGGVQSFAEGVDAGYFDAIHPVWYRLLEPCTTPDGGPPAGDCALLDGGCVADAGECTGCEPGVDFCENNKAHDQWAMSAAQNAGVKVIPTIQAVNAPTRDALETLLSDQATWSSHAAKLVAEANARGYDGFDIDYEHVAGLEHTSNLLPFLATLSEKMHAAGKEVDVDPPFAITFQAQTRPEWNFAELSRTVDTIHVQAYDFHAASEPGPNAPAGLIMQATDFIVANAGVAQSDTCKFIIGLPNYCLDWSAGGASGPDRPGGLDWCANALCEPVSVEISDHQWGDNCIFAPDSQMSPDGVEKRCFSRSQDPQASPRLYFDDAASLCEKVAIVANARPRLGGITYWQLGGEPRGFWNCVKAAFPSP